MWRYLQYLQRGLPSTLQLSAELILLCAVNNKATGDFCAASWAQMVDRFGNALKGLEPHTSESQ
mgnify:CR=1 FL=1